MAKSHGFSVYLLKIDYDASNALAEDHSLMAADGAALPDNATAYILDGLPSAPWWQSYFELDTDLSQVQKGAIIFLPVGSRCFALLFGNVSHHLDDNSYEYDFGLRVTLNSLDPAEIKSADMVAPGVGRRKRTQVPNSTELTYLDFDSNSEVIKSLTGSVKPEYRELFKNATGSTSLKIRVKLDSSELRALCEELLKLYDSDSYKTTFPNIDNITIVKDPAVIDKLNSYLLIQFIIKMDERSYLFQILSITGPTRAVNLSFMAR